MSVRILVGDCRERLRDLSDASVNCCVTSPPYFGLRDYGCEGQMGLEPTPDEFVAGMVEVFREVRRVLRDDGTLWLNIGDTYAANRGYQVPDGKHKDVGNSTGMRADALGCKPKDLLGIPWMLAFALRADGWYLRQDIIWSKPNPMPESVRDRCTKAHEYLFLLSKGPRYYYDAEAIAEPVSPSMLAQMRQGYEGSSKKNYAAAGAQDASASKRRIIEGALKRSGNKERKPGTARGCPEGSGSNVCGSVPWEGSTRNKRSVWEVATQPFSEAHFATYPPALIEPCILAGCPQGGTVLDPFSGAGTTGLVADRHQRNAILIELNPEYAAIAERRIHGDAPMFAQVEAA